MRYRNGNYCAFYVEEPFNQNNLGASATPDFATYNILKAWKRADGMFPFIDSHEQNYNVRDNSDWETTLKPRLRERIRNSKNIVLILSDITRNSRALREEIDYGINIEDNFVEVEAQCIPIPSLEFGNKTTVENILSLNNIKFDKGQKIRVK